MSNSDFRAPTTWTGSLASIRAEPQEGDRVLPGDVAPGSRQITGADRATGAQITRRTARSIETTLNDAAVRAAASHHQRSATNLMSW
jgi:hypothetical protein